MSTRTPYIGFVICAAIELASPWHVDADDSPDIASLIVNLDDNQARKREDAAEALAEIVDPRIEDPLRKRIAVEKDFHVKLALHYALASQGNRAPLQVLIESLRSTGHMGANYLRNATGEDFGWDIGRWQKWLDSTNDAEFRAFVLSRWKRKPLMDEWADFASLFTRHYFNSLTDAETGESLDLGDRMTAEEIQRLSQLPTAKAWNLFESALNELQDKGNRKESARLFRKVATEFSNTYYADQSKELADLLDTMVAEDAAYKPPRDITSLERDQQIELHIHNLRDVVAYQFSQPGYCHVLFQFQLPGDKSYNAALALRDIGEPAVPRLIELLTDRRPIRAVGYWRDFHPNRTVLRYQDAAIQILSAIRSDCPYDRRTTSSYFSTERPEVQRAVIESLKSSTKSK